MLNKHLTTEEIYCILEEDDEREDKGELNLEQGLTSYPANCRVLVPEAPVDDQGYFISRCEICDIETEGMDVCDDCEYHQCEECSEEIIDGECNCDPDDSL